jgi:competence ComEA-like helix-hairpin-helix protein
MKKYIALILGSALFVTSNIAAAAKPTDCKVNINTATAEQIENCLDRVGGKLADAIVEWRDKQKEANKDFVITNVEQMIGKVPRFGKKIAENNAAKICFDDKCTEGSKEAPLSQSRKGRAYIDPDNSDR